MLRVTLILALLALPLLAGCIQNGDIATAGVPALETRPDWAAHALPFGDGHDHYDVAAHQNLSTPNFELLGHDPLVTEHYGKGGGGYLCGDANGNASRRLAVVHSLGSNVAFTVVDVTDPLAPRMLGELVLRGTYARDVAVTADTRWVVVGTSGIDQNGLLQDAAAVGAPVSAIFRDACGVERPVALPFPEGLPVPSGLLLVSLENPNSPRAVDYLPLPVLGAHSVGVDRVDGVDIVTASVTNVAQHASYFQFLTIEQDKLVLQSVYQHMPVAANAAAVNLHNDGWVRKHPVTNQTVAYLADWDSGLALVDLTDIKAPKPLGRWSDYDAAQGMDNTAAVHSALPLEGTWGERHYTFIGQEILAHPARTPTGVISVLDTTDPAAPERVAAWTLPVDVEWDSRLVFSTHYLALVNQTLFVTVYHGGVWAVDVSDPLQPRSAGVFLPAIAPPEPPQSQSYSWAPTVMEAEALDTGELVVWDSTSGIYVVRYEESRPAPRVEEWPLALPR